MTLIQIKCLWEVTVTGNFSEAAEHLYLTQSSVSKNIIALEEELSVALLDRSSRPYVLSSAGREMMVHFGEIILAFERANFTLEEIKRRQLPVENNSFRLIGMPAMSRFGVSASIHSFVRENPNYNISLEEMDEDRAVLALQMGNCDVAFCTNLRLNLNNYNFQKYYSDTLSIAFSSKHQMASSLSPSLSSMANQSWIFPPQQSPHYHNCIDACQRAGFIPNVILSTSRPHTAMEYLHNHSENCMYMEITSILSSYMTDLHYMIPLENTPEIEFYFVWKRNEQLPKAATDFLGYVALKSSIAG